MEFFIGLLIGIGITGWLFASHSGLGPDDIKKAEMTCQKNGGLMRAYLNGDVKCQDYATFYANP